MSDTSINVKPNESGVGGEAVAWMYEVSNGCDPEYWMTTCDKYKPEGPRYRNIRPLIFGDAPPPQPRAEGMVLVPIEPTPGMIQAFWGEVTHGDAELAHAINAYRDMLSAAPSEGGEGETETWWREPPPGTRFLSDVEVRFDGVNTIGWDREEVRITTPPPASQSATPSDELPELPASVAMVNGHKSAYVYLPQRLGEPLFTADQMRAYGQLCRNGGQS